MTDPSFVEEIRATAWAMEPEALRAFARKISSDVPARSFLEPRTAGPMAPPYELVGKTAIVSVSGTLMRSVPSWFAYFGVNATATPSIKAAVEQAVADPRVSAICLRVNSPGGDAQGLGEVADSIYAARKKKRVYASVGDMAASGAYWLASQADEITAAPDAFVGSIGVYSVWDDSSEAAAKAGVKIHVVRAGDHKGMGEPGAPITPEQLAGVQKLMDGLAALFVGAVARGRKQTKSTVSALATGQVWLGEDAKTQGLVDRIEPVGAALSRIAKEVSVEDQKNADELARAKSEAVAAERKRGADLRAAFPKHPAFSAVMFEQGKTLAEAKAEFADVIAAELEEQKAQNAKTLAELETARKPAASRPAAPAAAPPVRHGGDPAASPASSSDFMALARAYAAERKCSMTQAMRVVAARNPDGHREWVASLPKIPTKERYERRNISGERLES